MKLPGDHLRGVDLSRYRGDEALVGSVEPVGHARVSAVYVVLKNGGELSEAHAGDVAQFAIAAAQAASKVR